MALPPEEGALFYPTINLIHDTRPFYKKVQPPPEVECHTTGSQGCLPTGGPPCVTRNETRIRGFEGLYTILHFFSTLTSLPYSLLHSLLLH